MARIAYKDVVTILLDRFPEFKETDDFRFGVYLDLPYMVWGAFGRFITTYMQRLPARDLDNDDLVNRVFDFANELLDAGDEDTKTIVVIELFENFYGNGKTLELGRRKLKPEHVTWLNRQGEGFGTSDLHYEGELIAPNGLGSLEWLLSRCSWKIEVLQHSETETLSMISHDQKIELETAPGEGPLYSFFGSPNWHTNETEARKLLRELSQQLGRGGIVHRIQLYRCIREDVLLEHFHHNWPLDDAKEDLILS